MTWLYYPELKNGVQNRAVLELWKYRSKKSLLQIAHLRCHKSRCITVGNLTLLTRTVTYTFLFI
jgi:hypothetical protein